MFQSCDKLATITLGPNFGQEKNVPDAGENTGIFRKGTPRLDTTVVNANVQLLSAYNWSADNRNVTFETR